jgi:hypothetical protein
VPVGQSVAENRGPRRPASPEEIDRWARLVVDRIHVPVDAWAVAAALEAEGLRDADAVERFGYPDLFRFGEAVHARTRSPSFTLPPLDPPPTPVARSPLLTLFGHLFEGSFFALPMIGQSVCVVATGHSLWASLEFTELEASVVGLGTLASFVATAGFVVSLGRQGAVYRTLKAFTLLRRSCTQLVIAGAISCVAVAAVLAGVELVAMPLRPTVAGLALLYFLALSALWIGFATLYMLQVHAWTFGLSVGGALLVAASVRLGGLPLVPVQLAAIVLTALASLVVASRRLRVLVASEDRVRAATRLPPPEVVVGILAPYAVYGMAYFALLLTDRALAWTAPGRHVPQAIWFDAPYELGMDWALVTLLVPMTYLERVVHVSNARIEQDQRSLPHSRCDEHRRRFRWFTWRATATLAALSALSVGGTYFGGGALRRYDNVKLIRGFFASPTTTFVFWPAAVGYQLLTVGLMFGLLFFTLGQPRVVLRAMTGALVVALVVGFAASRLLGGDWAVLGFTTGTAFFAVQMARAGRTLVQRVDYFHYAAY